MLTRSPEGPREKTRRAAAGAVSRANWLAEHGQEQAKPWVGTGISRTKYFRWKASGKLAAELAVRATAANETGPCPLQGGFATPTGVGERRSRTPWSPKPPPPPTAGPPTAVAERGRTILFQSASWTAKRLARTHLNRRFGRLALHGCGQLPRSAPNAPFTTSASAAAKDDARTMVFAVDRVGTSSSGRSRPRRRLA